MVTRALATGDRLIEITGGEPLLQPEVFPLMTALADAGRTVLLETSGAVNIGPVNPRVTIILDVKTPGSGEVSANLDANLALLKPTDEVKYVVCDRADFDWAVAHVRAFDLTSKAHVLIGAAHGQVDPSDLAAWVLETGLPLRLQVQLHKLLWGADHPRGLTFLASRGSTTGHEGATDDLPDADDRGRPRRARDLGHRALATLGGIRQGGRAAHDPPGRRNSASAEGLVQFTRPSSSSRGASDRFRRGRMGVLQTHHPSPRRHDPQIPALASFPWLPAGPDPKAPPGALSSF